MATIFCVEDDQSIRQLVLYALKSDGHTPQGFESGEEFWKALQNTTPDLILLDIMLPGEDGLSILKRLKASDTYKHIPVILLTAKTAEYDKVNGLDLGADDYISKPFGVMEFLSRVRALLRRCAPQKETQSEAISFGGVTIDYKKRVVLANNEPCTLTYKEFELLYYLLKNRGIVLSRDKIMEVVWGFDFEGESRTVDMHIKTLRQKLEEHGVKNLIQTVRSVGYKIEG